MKIGFIGTGNMGGALARAAAKGGHTLLACQPNPGQGRGAGKGAGRDSLPERGGRRSGRAAVSRREAAGPAGSAGELAPVVQARKGNAPVVVSMATAVTLRELDAMLGGGLPAHPHYAEHAGRRRRGHDSLCRAECDGRAAERLPRRSGAGRAVAAPAGGTDRRCKRHLGCGPAFCFQFADALALGGVRAGLSYPDACRLAAQTCSARRRCSCRVGKRRTC